MDIIDLEKEYKSIESDTNERKIYHMKNMKLFFVISISLLITGLMSGAVMAQEKSAEEILSGMTLDEKISQMIIPAIRTWDEENVTDLSAVPELAEALQEHQYGGILLYGSNVSGTEQLTRLIADLQANNAAIDGVSTHIPYLMPVDEEGGIVTRVTSGTRMTGNMAIGATGDAAEENARIVGDVIGEELAALGFNTDFAPVIDVNNNAANPVIGTRSFSDEPQMVSDLGIAYAQGLNDNEIIATYKHYPGHGDTGTDSHIGTPSIEKTYDQIKELELVPFKEAIDNGADLIMTAHITFPLIDEEVVFGDGETKGYYPATMSKKMISDILRGDLGFDGVVVADALEMEAIQSAGLVPGEKDSVEYQANIAVQVILADTDILLVPLDMTNEDAVTFYDEYIETLKARVEDGTIPEEQIDDSVLRILKLKEKYKILDADPSGVDVDAKVEHALQVVGSDEHHEAEMNIAMQAITMLKNEGPVLPVDGTGKKIVFVGRQADDSKTILYTLWYLQEEGIIDEDTQIADLAGKASFGSEDAQTKISIDYYYDPDGEETMLHYTDDLKEAVSEADVVICLAKTFSLGAMAEDNDQYVGISSLITDAHAAGAKVVFLSDNLPYDASRYQDADAILLAYMGSGLDIDPTSRSDGSANMLAYNANVTAAIRVIFGDGQPQGILPVNIPAIELQEDGSLAYTDEILYEIGYGLSY